MYIFLQLGSAHLNSVIKAAFDMKNLLTFCFFNQKSMENSGKSFYNILGKINPVTDFGK